MSALSIRPARPDERAAVLALLTQAALPVEDLGDASMAQFSVAESAGRIVGTVALEPHADCGFLRSLAVAPEARARGVGAALVSAVYLRKSRRGTA